MSPRKKNVTAKDIARACGLSQATVSYVMNNKEGKKISEATRRLVLQTARELNYIPNSTARSMRTNRSMSIGVVTGWNNLSMGFSLVLRGVKEYLDAAGYSITLLHDDVNAKNDHEYVRYYRSARIDGLLFLFYEMEPETMALLQRERIPFFLVDESGVWHTADQSHTLLEDGIRQAVSLCRERGFRRLKFFSLQRGDSLFSKKWNLFSRAIQEEYPQAELQRLVFPAHGKKNESLREEFYQALCQNPADAAISSNPRTGWLVQGAILRREFSLPPSVRHICLAASGIFELAYPTITCLDMPLEEMGKYAARQIVRSLSGLPVEEHTFAYTLKEGHSTQ